MALDTRKWLGSDSVELFLRIMVAVTVIISLILFIRQTSFADCQTRYNQAHVEYTSNNQDIAILDNKLVHDLFRSIYDAGQRHNAQTANDMNAAYIKYFTTVDLIDKQRSANPPPPFPIDYCG